MPAAENDGLLASKGTNGGKTYSSRKNLQAHPSKKMPSVTLAHQPRMRLNDRIPTERRVPDGKCPFGKIAYFIRAAPSMRDGARR